MASAYLKTFYHDGRFFPIQKEIEIAEFEIRRRELELEYQVRKPAEAEKYRLEKIAEAERKRIIMEAEAEAEAIALKGLQLARQARPSCISKHRNFAVNSGNSDKKPLKSVKIL